MPPPSAEETAQAIELGHEPSTVSVRGVAWFFLIFFISGIVIHVLVYIIYRQLTNYEQNALNKERSALTTAAEVHPPEPRLQPTRRWHETTEWEDLALMRGRENLEFVRRGWITENGEFRIPEDVLNQVAASGGSVSGAAPTSNPASGGTGAGMPR